MDSMKSDELEIMVSKFLNGDLSRDQEREALHSIAEDEYSREMLRFNRFLESSLKESREAESFSVPEGFADDVMCQIEQMEAETETETKRSWFIELQSAVDGWFRPREFTFRPAFVYALPVLLLAGFVGLMQPQDNSVVAITDVEATAEYASYGDGGEQVWIRFVYIDQDADQLAVAGNFSDWDPIEMESQMLGDKKIWTGMVPVERGEHHYMFIKNGEEWITDPLADLYRDDGFGNKNAVIYL